MSLGGIARNTWIALAFVSLLGIGASAQRKAPRGYLFIVGGGAQSAAMVQRYVELAGGKKAKIVVFAMASSMERSSTNTFCVAAATTA